MAKLLIQHSMHLKGEIAISGAKNAVLPIMCASILLNSTLNINNIPDLTDVDTLIDILLAIGVKIDWNKQKKQMSLCAENIISDMAPYELVKKMRASILVLGPLLSRFGTAKVSLPGGCAIGVRPVDIHIKCLQQLGATVIVEDGYIHATGKLKGTSVVMEAVTVTGTENILMAAVYATGTTIIENCSIEPEVTDLALCLKAMGANINGIGTSKLAIVGVSHLQKTTNYTIMFDRIEAGTYAIAAAITQGCLKLINIQSDKMKIIIEQLRNAGVSIECKNDYITVSSNKTLNSVSIITQVYPGMPTDMQAQFMVLNTVASSVATIKEKVFENRFMHVAELLRMGANIKLNGNTATVTGVKQLLGANTMATDLRASASLVLAGLVAINTTTIDRIYHLFRGYENLHIKLKGVGANIALIK